ncbi:hypothetical protein L9F63_014414, partial [Diploptera punctata]
EVLILYKQESKLAEVIIENMKLTLRFAILIAFVAILQTPTDGVQYREIVKPNPDYPGKCFHSLSNTAHSVGEKWQIPNLCIKFHCFKEDNVFIILANSCGKTLVGPSCRIVNGPKNAPYPRCCPQVQCSNNTAVNNNGTQPEDSNLEAAVHK